GRYFINENKEAITDDHVPLQKKGIRIADVIDIDYCTTGINCVNDQERNLHHTLRDTYDKVSAHSLQVVGDVAVSLVTSSERGAASGARGGIADGSRSALAATMLSRSPLSVVAPLAARCSPLVFWYAQQPNAATRQAAHRYTLAHADTSGKESAPLSQRRR